VREEEFSRTVKKTARTKKDREGEKLQRGTCGHVKRQKEKKDETQTEGGDTGRKRVTCGSYPRQAIRTEGKKNLGQGSSLSRQPLGKKPQLGGQLKVEKKDKDRDRGTEKKGFGYIYQSQARSKVASVGETLAKRVLTGTNALKDCTASQGLEKKS